MNPESEHQSNAPEKTAKGPTSEENVYSADPSRKRIRRGAIKRHIKKTSKPASKYNCDGSVIKEWRPPSQETGTPWLESTPSSLQIEFQSVLPLSFRSLFFSKPALGLIAKFSAFMTGPSHRNLRTLSAEISSND